MHSLTLVRRQEAGVSAPLCYCWSWVYQWLMKGHNFAFYRHSGRPQLGMEAGRSIEVQKPGADSLAEQLWSWKKAGCHCRLLQSPITPTCSICGCKFAVGGGGGGGRGWQGSGNYYTNKDSNTYNGSRKIWNITFLTQESWTAQHLFSFRLLHFLIASLNSQGVFTSARRTIYWMSNTVADAGQHWAECGQLWRSYESA